jgi:hypothetical protein
MGQKEVIMQAARSFREPFTIERLIVAAWMLDRVALGLAGYEHEFPDSKKVSALVYGRRGLIAGGELAKIQSGLLHLPERNNSFSPYRLDLAMKSLAYKLFMNGRKHLIVTSDAFRFWGIGDGGSVESFGKLVEDRDTPEKRALANCHDFLVGKFGKYLG